MANYQHKRSQVAGKVPLAGDLLEGEIAVNIKDRKFFSKDDQGVVFEFLGGNLGGVETVNGVSPISGNVTLTALNIPPTADRLWLTQAERQLIAGFDAYDKTESDDRYLLEVNNLSDLTNAATARNNLGLGTAATRDVGESTGNLMEAGAGGLIFGKLYTDFNQESVPESQNKIFYTGLTPTGMPSFAGNYQAGFQFGQAVQGSVNAYDTQIAYGATGSAGWRQKENGVWADWKKFYDTGNTTVDVNGFIKEASPIVRLYKDKIEEVMQPQGAIFENLGIGDYKITGTLGFSQSGWYIETPKDANGNIKFITEYNQDENGTLFIKTFEPVGSGWKPEKGDPVEITDGRWIDIRLEPRDDESEEFL